MGNTDITTREGYERSTLSGSGEQIRHGTERGSAIYSVIAAIVGIVFGVAAISAIDSWAQWVVLGVIVVTTIGFMIAVSPNRRG